MSATPDPKLVAAVCAALREQAARLGLSIGDEPLAAAAVCTTQVDPYSQETSLQLIWRGGARDGCITFFPDGRIFADYQVLLPHPALENSYVEAVQVWGTPDKLRGEPVIAEFAR